MKIAFIAVNYNNSYITINYVNSILQMKNIDSYDFSIVIIDNNSNLDDYKYLKSGLEGLKNVKLIKSDKNLGYFGGLNLGIKQIEYDKYDYVLVGNNDIIFEYDFCNKLANKKYKDDEIVVVPDLKTLDGVHQNPQFINRPSKLRKLCYSIYYTAYPFAVIIDFVYNIKRKFDKEKKKVKLEENCRIFWCTGACMLLRPNFFKKCGLLDDTFFLWGEEAALTHQIEEANGALLYDSDLFVLHFENASVRKIASKNKYKIFEKSYNVYKHYI